MLICVHSNFEAQDKKTGVLALYNTQNTKFIIHPERVKIHGSTHVRHSKLPF